MRGNIASTVFMVILIIGVAIYWPMSHRANNEWLAEQQANLRLARNVVDKVIDTRRLTSRDIEEAKAELINRNSYYTIEFERLELTSTVVGNQVVQNLVRTQQYNAFNRGDLITVRIKKTGNSKSQNFVHSLFRQSFDEEEIVLSGGVR